MASTVRKLETLGQQRQQQVPYQPIQPKKSEQVGSRKWISTGEKWLYSLFAIMMIVSSIVVVTYSASIDSTNRQIHSLEGDIQDLKLQSQSLELEVKELSKPDRILEIAKNAGMDIRYAEVKQAKTLNN
ncbi:cell division protein FtsL [Bacillaceae bacterium S4-13-58]